MKDKVNGVGAQDGDGEVERGGKGGDRLGIYFGGGGGKTKVVVLPRRRPEGGGQGIVGICVAVSVLWVPHLELASSGERMFLAGSPSGVQWDEGSLAANTAAWKDAVAMLSSSAAGDSYSDGSSLQQQLLPIPTEGGQGAATPQLINRLDGIITSPNRVAGRIHTSSRQPGENTHIEMLTGGGHFGCVPSLGIILVAYQSADSKDTPCAASTG